MLRGSTHSRGVQVEGPVTAEDSTGTTDLVSKCANHFATMLTEIETGKKI